MIDMQTNVFDCPGATGTIFTVIDDLATVRVVTLKNLSALTLTCQYQYSTDGGSTWTDLGASFTLGALASGSETNVNRVTQTGRIRLRASGGSDDKELFTGVMRVLDGSITTFPLIRL